MSKNQDNSTNQQFSTKLESIDDGLINYIKNN